MFIGAAVVVPALLRVEPDGAEPAAAGATSFSLQPGNPPVGPMPTVAVLPLTGRSLRDADPQLVDGLHAEVVARLGQVPGLRVLSPAAGMRYGESSVDDRGFGPELVVDYLVESGVELKGDSVRLDVRLVGTRGNVLVSARTYHHALSAASLLRIPTDVADHVAESIQAGSSPRVASGAPTPRTADLEAYEWFLRGGSVRFAGYVPRDIRYAIHCYEQAVDLDPAFAVAWARLAVAYAELFWFAEPKESSAGAALGALQRARELAPDHTETRLAGGIYAYRVERRYEDALEELDGARAMLPNDPRIPHLIAAISRRTGRWGEAGTNFSHAVALDPSSATNEMELGIVLFLVRRYEEAADHLARAIELDPSLTTASAMLAWVNLGRGADPAAEAARIDRMARAGVLPSEDAFLQYARVSMHTLAGGHRRALAVLDLDGRAFLEAQPVGVPSSLLRGELWALLGQAEAARGEFHQARRVLEARIEREPDDARFHGSLGLALAGLGQREGALRHAMRAVELMPLERDAWYGAYPLEDLARTHARLGNDSIAIHIFEDLLARPGPLSRAYLRLDPRLARLRATPRFLELIHAPDRITAR